MNTKITTNQVLAAIAVVLVSVSAVATIALVDSAVIKACVFAGAGISWCAVAAYHLTR